MRITIYLFLFFLSLAPTAGSLAQGWEKLYDQGTIDQVLVSPGGDLFLEHSIALSRTDGAGELEWTQLIGLFSQGELIGPSQLVLNPAGELAAFQSSADFGSFSNFLSVYNKLSLTGFDEDGNTLWENEFNPDPDTTFAGAVKMVNATDSGYLVLTRKNSENLVQFFEQGFGVVVNKTYPKLVKVDGVGQLEWSEVYFPQNGGSLRPYDLAIHPQGGYVVLVEGNGVNLLRVNEQGDEISREEISFPASGDYRVSKLVVLPQGDYLVTGRRFAPQPPSGPGSAYLARVSANGGIVWLTDLGLDESTPTDLLHQADGRTLLLANYSPLAGKSELTFTALSADGSIQWSRRYPYSFSTLGYTIGAATDGGYYLGGSRSGFYETPGQLTSKGFLMKVDSLGLLYPNFLDGNVFEDLDGDCDTLVEAPLEGWLIQVLGTDEHYALTDSTGYYALSLDTGSYQVRVFPPSNLWTACAFEQSVTVEPYDSVAAYFPIQALVECPRLQVDISTPFLRRCFDNTYTVQYCNTGTAPAYDAYVEVTLDPFLTFSGATVPLSGQQNDTYTFEVGDVDVGDCGNFTITVTVDCDSTVLGQTHCVEAHIFPDSPCIYSANWSGASVEVGADCQGDSLEFRIRNVGSAPTDPALNYLVIEDQIILQQDEFQLGIAEEIKFKMAATGTTFRLEAEQEPFHPGNSTPSVTVEGCGAPFPDQMSLGFVTQYWEDDGNFFISIDCQENIGSYDPNDKRGFPQGYGFERFIEPGQEIEYHIRFQNTGTDTAFKVVILDRLDEALDLTSVRPGASSHPFAFQIREDRTLEFAFDPIALPDSTVNEAASHGFVKFRVAQRAGNPPGMEIRNTAAIYFDFNEPIITNTTVHRIATDFVEVFMLDDEETPLQMTVAPNPFSETARIDLTALGFQDFLLEEEEFQLIFYDTRGRLVRRDRFSGPTYDFHRGRLTEGLYFYQLTWNGRRMSSGKVIVQ